MILEMIADTVAPNGTYRKGVHYEVDDADVICKASEPCNRIEYSGFTSDKRLWILSVDDEFNVGYRSVVSAFTGSDRTARAFVKAANDPSALAVCVSRETWEKASHAQ